MNKFFTYIVTNKRRGTLYTGMTNSIRIRSLQHKKNVNKSSFTYRYKLKRLVWYESFSTASEAIHREKEIKGWKREKKIAFIEKSNPNWKDLYGEIFNKSSLKYSKMSDVWKICGYGNIKKEEKN